MGTDYSSAEFSVIWLTVLVVIGLAMALYVMRRKALSLLTLNDHLADRIRLLEEEAGLAAGEKDALGREVLGLKSTVADVKAERDDFIDLLNASPFAIWRRDQQSRIIWHNRKYEEIVGPPDGMGDVDELASSREPEQARKLAAKARVSQMPQTEKRRFVVGGDLRNFLIYEIPLEFENQLAGFAEDISREEGMVAEMKSHVEGHANVLQNMTTAVAIYGPDQTLIFFNQTYADLWRMDEAFLLEKPTIMQVIDKQRELRRLPEQADFSAYKAKRKALFTNLIETQEELVQLPDETMLRTVIAPHSFGGLLFMFEDVTDKMVLERARNTQIAVQRATLDNLHEGVAVFGADARLKLFNSNFRDIWGFSPEFLQENLHISAIVDEMFRLGTLEEADGFREDNIANVTRRDPDSGRLEQPGGRVIDFNRVPLPDGNVLFTYVDVTDALSIQRVLTERNEALEAADRMKSEFVASVSHELRTPLNTIIGFGEILVKQFFGPLNDKQKEYGKGILDSSNHLLHLINDILDMANIQAGSLELDKEPVEIHSMLANVVTMIHDRARKRRLSLDFEVSSDLGWANLDERRMKQAIFNLFSNAIKFTPPGGHIALKAEKTADEIIIQVTDTGVGIPDRMQVEIFERFSKGDTTRENAGAGLGLSLVKSFVEMHGGRVDLQSAENKGTTVTCHLPAELCIESLPA
ncbi:PAS domain-containing sensor histidine kinase [Sneathiella chinensis]|uniref:histidine kinase n=1 Tax=Sneathiella chinensis TaxID=349750 RepID=A0ABQ5U2Z9_9PROT|nr:PAS domain-containing sensor histidine kinase [Sneathiella chinensis]GLQ04871.1 two-component sensor histidine kinase [Sneathiella chinensis]